MTGKQVFNSTRNLASQTFAAHKFFSIAVLGVAVLLAYQFAGGIIAGIYDAHTDRRIAHTETQAAHEVSEAAGALHDADAASVDRQVEDRVRAATIEPERARAARQITAIRERSRIAEMNYEAAQKNFRRPDLSEPALHALNCGALANLYPAERFARCER
jgi:hypothetical protein